MDVQALYTAIAAVCPIQGVRPINPSDRSTWIVDFDPTATPAQQQAAQQVVAAYDPTKPTVPTSVTRLQGRLALSHAGLLSAAESAIVSAGGDLPIWYSDAATWVRDDPHVSSLGATLNLTSAQIDALFVQAAAVQ